MDLNNPVVKKDMNCFFGKERADALRERLKSMQPEERESTLVDTISQALKDVRGSHVQDFCFKRSSASRTSHYLIFISKNKRGHSIMKDIMAKRALFLLREYRLLNIIRVRRLFSFHSLIFNRSMTLKICSLMNLLVKH